MLHIRQRQCRSETDVFIPGNDQVARSPGSGQTARGAVYLIMVERIGIEPMTSSLQS